MSRQIDKTTEDKMYYPNRLQPCTHKDDEIQLKLNLRDHAFFT